MAKVAILALTFIRSTKVYIPTKLSYEALNRHFCQTAVTSWRSVCRVIEVLVCCVFRCRCRVEFMSPVGWKKIKTPKGGKKKIKFFLGGEKHTLLQTSVCVVACSGLEMCVFLRVGHSLRSFTVVTCL